MRLCINMTRMRSVIQRFVDDSKELMMRTKLQNVAKHFEDKCAVMRPKRLIAVFLGSATKLTRITVTN